jgi:hypothetical protein
MLALRGNQSVAGHPAEHRRPAMLGGVFEVLPFETDSSAYLGPLRPERSGQRREGEAEVP